MAVQSNSARPLTISHNEPFPDPGKSPTTSVTELSSTYDTNLANSHRQSKNKKQCSANATSIDSYTTSWSPIDHFTDQTTCAESWALSSQYVMTVLRNEHMSSVTQSRDPMSVSLNQYRYHHLRNKLLPYILFLVTFLTVFHLAGANIRLAPKYHHHRSRESLTIPSFDPKVHLSVHLDKITENVKYFNADVRQPFYRRIPINSYHSAISGVICIICMILYFNTLIACLIL